MIETGEDDDDSKYKQARKTISRAGRSGSSPFT